MANQGPIGRSATKRLAQIHPADGDGKRFTTVVSDAVEGDLTFGEYIKWLGTQEWYKTYGFDRRVGMGFAGGSLLGVSNALARVFDKNNKVTDGESMPHEGPTLARFYDKEHPEGAPHKSKVVWDAPHCAAVAEAVTGRKPPLNDEAKFGYNVALKISGDRMPDEGIEAWKGGAPANCLLPEKRSQLNHVADALGAMSRALEAADERGRGGGAVYCTDYFGLRERVASIKREQAAKDGSEMNAAITPDDIAKTNKVLSLEPPIMMLNKVTHIIGELALIVPCPVDAKMDAEETIKAWREHYPSRTLVIIPVKGTFKITTSFNILAAITHASRDGKMSTSPRPCVVGVASGGYGVLDQMADVSNDRHSVRLLVLEGSGRIADLWAKAWPLRGSEEFDPDVAAQRLQNAACFPPSVDHIEAMRQVLSQGELILHPIKNQSSTLQRLVGGILTGDRLLQLAVMQHAAYVKATARANMPRVVLVNSSILLGFTSTLVAILVPPGVSQGTLSDFSPLVQALYYASIILPAVMLVVDQIEAYLGSLKSKEACERAAGLVESQAFRYKAHAGAYADNKLDEEVQRGVAGDLATARQLKLATRLNKIQIDVAKTGASVELSENDDRGHEKIISDVAGAIMKEAKPAVGAKGSSDADELNGDEYIQVRVLPAIRHSTKMAKYYQFYSLIGRMLLFLASAAGSVLATLGQTLVVAATVSGSMSISRWLETTRVEERRQAHMKAASELSCAKLVWESLPNEQRTKQDCLDKLVLEVENYLEATLPPAQKDEEGVKKQVQEQLATNKDEPKKAQKGQGQMLNMVGGTIKDLAAIVEGDESKAASSS